MGRKPTDLNGNTTSDFVSHRVFNENGTIAASDFAVAADTDLSKEVVFDPTLQATNTTVTIKSPAINSSIVVTLPSASGTLLTSGTASNDFGVISPDLGTSPSATGEHDTLTVTSSDSSIVVTGNSTTNTLDLKSATHGTVASVGTIDGQTASDNGLVIQGTAIYAQSASATKPGLVNNTTQSLSGDKTFTGAISASNLSNTNSGDVTIATGNGLTVASQALSLTAADTSHTGALTSTDWNTFNGKQASLTIGNLTDTGTDGITVGSGTGAVIGSGTSIAQHVADTTHNGYLSSTDWNTFNTKEPAVSKGDLAETTSAVLTVTGGTGAVIGSGVTIAVQKATASVPGYLAAADFTTFSGKQASGNYITALTSDVTASGPGSATATIASGAVSNSKLANMNDQTIKGNTSGGSSSPSDLTATQATAILNSFVGDNGSGGTKGLVPAPASGDAAAKKFLRAGGAWTAIVSGDVPTLNQNTSGSAASLSATLAIGSGGTGQTSASAAFNALSPMTTGGDIIYGGSSGAGTRLANGSAGQLLQSNGTTLAPTWVTVTATPPPVAYITDTKANGTNGGIPSATGSYLTRVLNTVSDPNSIVTSLSSNQFVLPAGTYRIFSQSSGMRCGHFQSRIRNITDSNDTLTGMTAFSNTGSGPLIHCIIQGDFTIAGSKTFELQTRVESTGGGDQGWGDADNMGLLEVYSNITLTKLA